jgi:hypothetical protein
MNHFARFLDALHASRRRAADRVIRQNWHLVEEGHAYERRRGIEAAEDRTAMAPRGGMQLETGSTS